MSYKNKKRNHIYPHIKEQHKEMNRKLYLEHVEEFNNWSNEERIKRGFGNHPHPRRFFIFIDRYFDLIKHYLTEEEKTKHVFPWIVATRSERLEALNKRDENGKRVGQVYFDIVKTDMKLAKLRKENVDQRRKYLKLGGNINDILDFADFNFPL